MAQLDSGAEITKISTNIYEKLKKKTSKVQDFEMKLADKDSTLKGFIIKPISMKLGSQTFKERVYVAPISNDMLFGRDLLHRLGILLDIALNTLILNGKRIPVHCTFKESAPTVARVTIIRRTVNPSNTVVRLKCAMSSKLDTDYYFQPNQDLKLVSPRVVRKKGEDSIVCLVNPTDIYQTLKRGKFIGHAFA
ncbi:hypothetical protein DPMN_108261 [Dreissena polymorpha]|uniref:Peptidase A2 domain-containing protein n=1 Tax=Dreissena polymorpha TaxID=45954 RepID=A0A9D4QKR8_DREPO|nr:hypothetical protein DPMN_108261 [Dreissena polymorpha]